MSYSYREVHFSPNPMRRYSFPVAALLRDDRGGPVRVVVAPRLPERAELGTTSSVAALRWIIQGLHAASEFSRLPASAGPHARLDETREIPQGVTDPAAWLVRHVLWRPAAARRGMASHPILPRRKWAARYFASMGLGTQVKERFRPAEHLDPRYTQHLLRDVAPDGRDVSFYYRDEGNLLLLEPLILEHAHLDQDLEAVTSLYAAYQDARREIAAPAYSSSQSWSEPEPYRLLALILPGQAEAQRVRVRRALLDRADEVLDLLEGPQRQRLLQLIPPRIPPLAAA